MSKRHKSVAVVTSVEGILGDAPSEIDDLKEEMASWRDALEDKFSGTEKYERVSEAADTLENADLDTSCGALVDAIEKAAEGEEGVEACPEHVAGTPCPACAWDGVLPTPAFERFDPPQLRRIAPHGEKLYVGRITKGHGITRTSTWFTDLEKFELVLASRQAPPPRRQAVVAVEPIAEFVELAARELKYTEAQAYKGKSLSRQDRLGNAAGALRLALDEVRGAVETFREAHKEDDADASTERSDLVDEIASAADELETALDDLDGVEFPGMYG